jgi:hypothetical protein
MTKNSKSTSKRARKAKRESAQKTRKMPAKPSHKPVPSNEDKKWLSEYPHELRGPAQNRFGGHRTARIKALKNCTFGPASPCRRLSVAERALVERGLREKGLL